MEESPKRKFTGKSWGGPAKGAGRCKALGLPAKGPGWGRLIPSPIGLKNANMTTEEMKKRDAERAEQMKKIILDIATDEKAHPETRLSAANSMLNRIEGQAVARNINANVDDVSSLSDDELRQDLARLGGKTPAPASRAKAARVPGKSGGMVQ